MTYFVGYQGGIKLKRSSTGFFSSSILPDDVNTILNRIGIEDAINNLLTGDRIVLTTEDPRGLECFPVGTWDSLTIESEIDAYININAAGGVRLFTSFEDAVNNNRSAELIVAEFSGDPIPVLVQIKDSTYKLLGDVTGYTINTDREAIDVTSLSDKFRKQYSAGLISGNGSIDCIFNPFSSGLEEASMLMLQLVQRIDVGSGFQCALYLVNSENQSDQRSIFYEFSGIVTRAGVTVDNDVAITCSIDFVSTGDIRLLVGEIQGYVLQENEDKLIVEPTLGYLLKETID
jgi:hypothetical protein